MADESGFDPCECVWGHEMAMRRLISLLRQSQNHCTDTECFQTVDGMRNQSADSLLITSLIIAFAFLMYFLRPATQRNRLDDPSKPANFDNDSNGFPPTPPTAF